MNIFNGLEKIVKKDHPLKDYTWFGIGGPAQYFITPTNTEQLADVLKRCNENQIETKILGYGSNLLISDEGVKGAVIKLDHEKFTDYQINQNSVTAAGGANLSKLVLETVRKGLGGIESLTGIPGSVGGAVRMNAGGKFGDIGAVVDSVVLMDAQGNTYKKEKPELIFNYRNVNITAKCILQANMTLYESDPEQMLKQVKEIWIYKKNSQPLNARNAGCVFKNPRSLSAGALIDRTGLKGLQIGNAKISEKHANFIITEPQCTCADVKRLIDAVRERVLEKFDIELELEIEIW